MRGILYGIGVGPGDPQLMTLAAVKAIENSDAVILPTEPKEECYAYRIVRSVIPDIDKKEILCRHFPMIRDKEQLKGAHDQIYEELQEMLDQGKDIAFLTIGDPSVYSTYNYMHERAVRDGYEAKMISGVPSFCAVAAALGISLGDGKDEIHIIPASYELKESLQLKGTKIYMKSGKKLIELKERLLASPKSYHEIYAVSDCGLPEQKIMRGVEELETESGYLTIVIVK